MQHSHPTPAEEPEILMALNNLLDTANFYHKVFEIIFFNYF